MAPPNKDDWFEEKIEPHESSLRTWLRSSFGLESMIDDVVQESYIRILKARNKNSIRSPRAYLFSTARNVAIDFLKDLKKHRHEPLENSSNIVHINQWDNSKDILEHRNEVELLKASIQTLPERCRKIFVMRKVHGMPSAEISRKLGISTHTVSAQLTIGLKKCVKYIEQQSGIHQVNQLK